MTPEDIAKVAKIMLTADGFCPTCGVALLNQLKRAFPEHEAVIEHVRSKSGEIRQAYHDSEPRFLGEPEFKVWDVKI